MDERALVEEILNKALQRGVISDPQKRFYLLRYLKGELNFEKLQEEVAQSPSTRQYPRNAWPYQFICSLGRGGMGEVIAASHRETGQKVAIKKIRFYSFQDPEARENARKRFLRECALQATLDHPNIVKVHDYGIHGEQLFLVTQLIEGETLHKIVQREKANPENYYKNVMPQLLEKMEGICDAIHYAHENGIIHRDINPKNIMIDKDDRMVVMDFGLAKKFCTDSTKLTKSNELLGTPSYMSPEQWENKTIGPASDVYSLGATLFYIITGDPPHPEEPNLIVYNMINRIPPNAVQVYRQDLPSFLNHFAQKALEYEISRRHPSAKAMEEALHHCVEQWRTLHSSIFTKIKVFFKQVPSR